MTIALLSVDQGRKDMLVTPVGRISCSSNSKQWPLERKGNRWRDQDQTRIVSYLFDLGFTTKQLRNVALKLVSFHRIV